MKTFETEKHNIPKGATHYFDEDHFNYFTWLMVDNDGRYWGAIEKEEIPTNAKPIPQTKGAEWDGEYQLEQGKGWYKYKITYMASNGDMFAMCHVPHANNGKPFEQHLDSETTKFRDLEVPEAKKELEELESAYDLYCVAFGDGEHLCDSFENFCKEDAHKFCRNAYIAIVRKTGYRVEE